ncbi:MAG: hypothetical protein L0206_25580, partial [Actinobacteria bacterium]|nr:hypothetical protein [Actinomycetota bacterium]
MRRSVTSLAIASTMLWAGAAAAEEEDEDPDTLPGDEGMDPCAGDESPDPTLPGSNLDAMEEPGELSLQAYPTEEVTRPINLPKGVLEAGVDLSIPQGPDDMGEQAVGAWLGFTVRGDYAVNEKIQVGGRIPLVAVSPDVGLSEGPKAFGGIELNDQYGVMDMLSARAVVGYGPPALDGVGRFAVPAYFGDMKPAFGLGAAFKRKINEQIAVTSDPILYFQVDGGFDDMGMEEMLMVFGLPIAGHYQVMPELVATLRTGFNTGHKFKASGDDGASIPLIAEAAYTLMEGKLDVGLDLGLGNVTPPEGVSAGDTFVIG